jgi:hypothetical protein
VKVFENAVLVFNKRQYSEAKSLFEDIIAKYPRSLRFSRASTPISAFAISASFEARARRRSPRSFMTVVSLPSIPEIMTRREATLKGHFSPGLMRPTFILPGSDAPSAW